MKRTRVFVLSLFYLSLTTGMFVCFIHCGAKDVAGLTNYTTKPPQSSRKMNASHSCCHKSKVKGKQAAGNCCKNHGNYVVKENLSPKAVPALSMLTGLVNRHFTLTALLLPAQSLTASLPAYGHGPPGISGKNYVIQIRSLLI